jgi:hypothetical protein
MAGDRPDPMEFLQRMFTELFDQAGGPGAAAARAAGVAPGTRRRAPLRLIVTEGY